MEKSKRKNKDKPIRVFKHYEMTNRIFVISGLFAPAVIFALGYSLDNNDATWMVIMFLLTLAWIASVFMLISSETITFYEEGLEHHINKSHTFVKWSELSHFATYGTDINAEHGIKTTSFVRDDIPIDPIIGRTGYKNFIPVSRVMTIPVKSMRKGFPEIDLDGLKRTEFGRLLNDYAPHLFEENNGKIKAQK